MNGAAARDTRVVLGHVAPVPWPVAGAARMLTGTNVDDASVVRCCEAAVDGARSLGGNAYKIQMVKAAVKRAAFAAAKA